MARPREFDAEEALQNALQVFWTKGYEATSMQDLVAAMGIQKASLYNTFGDKRRLYLAALRSYQQQALAQLMSKLAAAASPLAAIRAFILEQVEGASGRNRRQGCFCVNAAIELAPSDGDVAAQLRDHHGRMEALLAATLQRAKTLGELAPGADVEGLATFVLGQLVAIQVLSKQRTDRSRLDALARHGLAALA
jgi:TetR/AcrR family transcriptional regulator, transcriptional repressor for nem operon